MSEEVQQVPSIDNPFLSPAQVAQMFAVDQRTVHVWIKTGKLKAAKIEKRWRILTSEMEKFARQEYGDN